MKIGFAETDITPQMLSTMVGFNRSDNISRGVLDSLAAQVSVWEDNGLYCLVTIDNIGFNKRDANQLRDMIAELIGEPRERIMLSFSHTHAAVNTDIEKEYYGMLCQKVCDAVKRARTSMFKAYIGWDNVTAEIGVNRRKSSSKLDRRVGILKVCDADRNDVKLIILRLTAHCNALKRDNYLISADYFGAVRKAFTKKYNCPVMIVQGSAGNIAPQYYHSAITPIDGQGEEYINSSTAFDDIAKVIISEVEPVFNEIKVNDNINVSAYSEYVTLQSKVPDMNEAQQIADEALKYCGIDGQDWLKEVEHLRNDGILFQEERLEIQYFCVGNWCLCGIPNETMTEFALETEQLLGNPYFYFNGYTNGCSSYFPTKEEYDFGGYEVYWAMLIYFNDYGRVYPYNREAFDVVTAYAVKNYMG